MPHWLLPLLCLIVLGSFIYVGFWKGLSNKRDENNRDNYGGQGELPSPSPTDSHHS